MTRTTRCPPAAPTAVVPWPEGLGAAVAREVARLAQARGWSCNELADRAGLTRPSVAHRLRGRGVLDLAEVEALSAALGVAPVDLLSQGLRQPPAPDHVTGDVSRPVPAAVHRADPGQGGVADPARC